MINVTRVPLDFHARYSALSKTYSFHIQLGAIADPLLLDLSQHVFRDLDVEAMRYSLSWTHAISSLLLAPQEKEKICPPGNSLLHLCSHAAPLIAFLTLMWGRLSNGVVRSEVCMWLTGRVLRLATCRRVARLLEGTHDFTQFSSVSTSEYVSPIKTLAKAEVLVVPNGLKIVFIGSGFLYNQCRHMVGCLIRVGINKLSLEHVQELLCTDGELGKPAKYFASIPLADFLQEIRCKFCETL